MARETSRVTTALKNVSGSLGQFADNQRFLLDMREEIRIRDKRFDRQFCKIYGRLSSVGYVDDESAKNI